MFQVHFTYLSVIVFKLFIQVTGEWSGQLAGGCPNYSSHSSNPVYRLQLKLSSPTETAEVLLKLRGPK